MWSLTCHDKRSHDLSQIIWRAHTHKTTKLFGKQTEELVEEKKPQRREATFYLISIHKLSRVSQWDIDGGGEGTNSDSYRWTSRQTRSVAPKYSRYTAVFRLYLGTQFFKVKWSSEIAPKQTCMCKFVFPWIICCYLFLFIYSRSYILASVLFIRSHSLNEPFYQDQVFVCQ